MPMPDLQEPTTPVRRRGLFVHAQEVGRQARILELELQQLGVIHEIDPNGISAVMMHRDLQFRPPRRP